MAKYTNLDLLNKFKDFEHKLESGDVTEDTVINELINYVSSSNLPQQVKDRYEEVIDDSLYRRLNLSSVRKISNKLESEIAKLNKGYILIPSGNDDYELVNSKESVDEYKRVNAEIKDLLDEYANIDKERDKARAEELAEEIEKKKAAREEKLSTIKSTTETLLTSVVTGNASDEFFRASVTAITGILSLLPLAVGKVASKLGMYTSAEEKAKRLKELHDKEEDDKKKAELYEKIEKAKGELAKINSEIDEFNGIITKDGGIKIDSSEPMTKEEYQELHKEVSGNPDIEITDWDSAIEWGFQKLKSIYGEKYDEKIAESTLYGLKDKYPDNPNVVVGALKYGRGRSEDSREANSNGKIENWDEAEKYAKDKLKEFHGDEYDEKIADSMIEGLKTKYPNNPMVVVGVLKYRGNNSLIDNLVIRSVNSVPSPNSADEKIADAYVTTINNSNYPIIFEELAEKLGETNFRVNKIFKRLTDYRDWVAKDKSVTDRMFMIIDYLAAAFTGFKGHTNRLNCDLSRDMELNGVISQDEEGYWRITSNKTGEYWKPRYKSYDNALRALKAYHASKRNSSIRVSNSREFNSVLSEVKDITSRVMNPVKVTRLDDESGLDLSVDIKGGNNFVYSIDILGGNVMVTTSDNNKIYPIKVKDLEDDIHKQFKSRGQVVKIRRK